LNDEKSGAPRRRKYGTNQKGRGEKKYRLGRASMRQTIRTEITVSKSLL